MPLRHSVPRAMAILVALLLAACVPPPTETAAPAAPTEAQAYVIGPGDTLGVFVFRAPEFTTEVPVRPDGRISIPLVQDIQAAGRTPTELAREIERRIGQFMRDPNVTVIVRSFVGPTNRMVRVIGEAAEPQALAYRDGMTLLDVMIATKGLTRFAAGNRATVVRREADGTQRTIPVRLSDLLRSGDISQDIPMRPGDTLIIPQSWF